MDRGQKRSFEPSNLLQKIDRSRNELMRHHDDLMCANSDSRHELSFSSLYPNTDEYVEIHTNNTRREAKNIAKSSEKKNERRESNRLRAKRIRKKKKKMEQEIDRQLVLITIENKMLRAEGQMQRAELSLLRNSTIEATKKLLTNADDKSSVKSIGNDTGALLRFLPASNSRNSAATINPELSSSSDFATTPHHDSPFAPNVNVTSAASRLNNFKLGHDLISPELANLLPSASSSFAHNANVTPAASVITDTSFQLGLPTVDSIIRADHNITPSISDSSSLQIHDVTSGNDHNGMTISTERHSLNSSSFSPNANMTSATSRITETSYQLGLPTVDSIIRADPNIAPSISGLNSLQIPDVTSGTDHNGMKIPTESLSLNSKESIISKIDELIMSLLRDGQQPNLNSR